MLRLKKFKWIDNLAIPIILLSNFGLSQETNTKLITYLHFNGESSFWSQHNNYGFDLIDSDFFIKLDGTKKNIEYQIHFIEKENQIYFSESFLSFKIKNNSHIKFGRYYRDFSSYLNDNLSSGSLLISRNSMPMPKIGLSSNFFPKSKKNSFLFKYGISHAFFEKNDTYIKAPFLHEKFIYLISEKNNISYGIGLVHEAMWAGGTKKINNFPSSFKDFMKVFISADEPQSAMGVHANALGNHIGIWDFFYQRKTLNQHLTLYYQHIFEDTSGLRFANSIDGLWGINIKNHSKKFELNMEYLITTNQNNDPPYVSESYYNHGQYLEGWSYKNFSLGNPFINFLNVNPTEVLHLGFQKGINSKKIQILISKSIDSSDLFDYQIAASNQFQNFIFSGIVNGNHSRKNLGLMLSYKF